jgi:hypothetical protein
LGQVTVILGLMPWLMESLEDDSHITWEIFPQNEKHPSLFIRRIKKKGITKIPFF